MTLLLDVKLNLLPANSGTSAHRGLLLLQAACGRPSFLGQCRLPPQPDLYRNHQGSTAETPASAGQQDAYADNKRVARGSYTHLVQTRPYSRPECDK